MKNSGHGRIEELEDKIRDLKARLPRHSAQPSMLMELEELEEELERLRAQEIGGQTRDTDGHLC